MDLRVLKGKDPAGYQAEAILKDPSLLQINKRRPKTLRQLPSQVKKSEDGFFRDDPNMVHIFRRNKRQEEARLAGEERKRVESGDLEKKQSELDEAKTRLAKRAAKNRAKRKKSRNKD